MYIYIQCVCVYRFKGTWCRGCGGLMIAVFIIRHRHLAVLALASSKSEYDPLRKAALLVLNLGLHHRPDTNGGGPVRLQCLRTAPDHIIATRQSWMATPQSGRRNQAGSSMCSLHCSRIHTAKLPVQSCRSQCGALVRSTEPLPPKTVRMIHLKR